MLVLSRQRDETIVIGEGKNQVLLTVVDIRGDKVRLGIVAPEEIGVYRSEVYDAIKRDGTKKQGELETSLGGNDPLNSEGEKEKFQRYLNEKNYIEAQRLSEAYPSLATRDELYLLSHGLGSIIKGQGEH
jgi:carbon storage regulator